MPSSSESERKSRPRISWRSVVGGVLFAVGVVITGWLTVKSSSTEPPDELATISVFSLGVVFQVGSLIAFNGVGRPDPGLARAAVRRLIALTENARRAKQEAELASSGSAAEAKVAMGRLSVALSYIEEGVASSALDWAEFQPDATKKLEETDQ